MDYKNLWSCEHSRPRRPSLAPWENEEEGWESEQFIIKARQSPRSKSCVQHLQSSSKKRVAVDIGKTPIHNFSVKRNRQTRDKKRRTRYQIKINSISQTVQQDVPQAERREVKPQEISPPKYTQKVMFFTEESEPRSKPKCSSPQLIAPSKQRFSTISVQEVNNSLKATLRLFKQTLQDRSIQKVLSTPSAKCKPVLGTKSSPNNNSRKQLGYSDNARIVMPQFSLLGLPQQTSNPYSFAFFRNSKLTQSLPKNHKKRGATAFKAAQFQGVLPQLPI